MNLNDFFIIKKDAPHHNVIWVKILVKIKNNMTEEIRYFETDGIFDEDEDCFSSWIWSDGNFSCDCNRSCFFGDDDNECGDGKYSCDIINPKTGKTIYSEIKGE